jgi:hypothetical protein
MKALLDSQSQAIDKLSLLKVGALFKRPGTGKSRTAIELIKSAPNIEQVVWLAPFKSVNPIMEGSGIKSEVDKWGGFDVPIYYYGIESLSSSDRIYLELLNKVESKNTFLVCDESLLIKNVEANRTKRIQELSNRCEYKLILNGTPISRNLLDIKPQMDFLSRKILNMSDAEFKNTFCEYKKVTKFFGGKKGYTKEYIVQYHNIDYLYSLIRPYVYEADLCLEVGMQYIDASYKVSDEENEEYKRLKVKYLDNEKLQFMNNNIFLEMTMKMQHVYSCSEEKFAICKTYIDYYGEENVIIYCKFIDSKKECKKRFPNIPVLSIQSDAMSLNLQSRHVTIEFDKTWDFAKVDQYKYRTYRTGQTKDCIYIRLQSNKKLCSLMKENNDKKYDNLMYFKSITKKELKEVL